MAKRAMLVRSKDRGLHWQLVSTVSVDPSVGTEGLGEPALCRVGSGPHVGRLICLMRTGRNLFQAASDDAPSVDCAKDNKQTGDAQADHDRAGAVGGDSKEIG